MKIAKQDAQCVPDSAIRVPEARKDFFRERHVGRVINAARPKSQQIGAILADEVIGSGWLLVCAGFGDLFAVQIDHETMGHTGLVWRTIIQRDAGHQR